MDILAFACFAKDLHAVYGCGDDALYDQIATSENDQVLHYLRGAGREGPQALREIIAGEPLTQFTPSTYGYTLLAILFEIGTFLGSNGGSYGRQMEADKALRSLGENATVLPCFTTKWPVAELYMTDWPQIQIIPAPEVQRCAAIMKDYMTRITPECMAKYRESTYYFLVKMAEFFGECASLNRDLVLIAH